MTRSVYIASPEGRTGKSAVALGLLDTLAREVGSIGVFRPLVNSHRRDALIDVLLEHPAIDQTYDEARGVSYEAANDDPDEALSEIVARFGELAERHDLVMILGSDFTDVSAPTEHTVNARIAANLGSPVVMVVSGVHRTPHELVRGARGAIEEFKDQHAHVVAVLANRVPTEHEELTRRLLGEALPELVTGVMPEHPLLSAPSVREQLAAAEAALLQGDDEWLGRESMGVIVAGMTLPNVLDRLFEGATVVAPSDRSELLAGLLMAHRAETFPSLSGILLVGGYPIPEPITRLCAGLDQELPMATTDLGTFATAQRLDDLHGPLNLGSQRKVDTARRLFTDEVDQAALLDAIEAPSTGVRTPLMFEYELVERARKDRRRIVLPEATDDRILTAADIVLRRGIAHLTLLGDADRIAQRVEALGLDLTEADVVSPHDPELVERFAEEYARLRAHKGVTLADARERVTDISYFGTLMVRLGLADGMVSGAINTTAHTIRPSLEIIRTRPGVRIVSSVFLMCLADRVLVYGDCAVNPDPDAEQLADIAVTSAATAAAFDIEPRVAMLSYSTGASGTGADVDKVRTASKLVHERAPELPLEGPIQYDAAVAPDVARTKLPESEVAGRATVFVFPDLNTGNNTYKAVQRSAGAVAIGPVLQGLNKPVNDLSRGALVHDIVNTVAITAIQAQQQDAS